MSHKVLLGVMYKPPKVDDIDKLDELLQRFSVEYAEILIAGDFNEDLIARSGKTKRYESVIEGLSMNFVSNEPTHFSTHASTAIDHFVTSSIDKVRRFSQISLPGISKHDLIFLSFECDMGLTAKPPRMARRLDRMNVDDLLADAMAVDWMRLFCVADVDTLVDSFSNEVLQLLDVHAPLAPCSSRKSHNPWFDSDVDKALVDRDLAYLEWKRVRTGEKFCRFKVLRNRAAQVVSLAKKRFYARKLRTVAPSRQLWSSLRRLGFVSGSDEDVPPFTVDELNSHFTTRPVYSDFPRVIAVTDPMLASPQRLDHSFSFRCFTESEVVASINSIKSNSVGLDLIPVSFIKALLPVVLPIVTHVLNSIVTKSVFPAFWKRAKVLPLRKSSRLRSPDDYRPISILPSLSKALERLMKGQVTDYINRFGLLFKLQSGFRSGYSTASALLEVTSDIRDNMSKGLATVLLLLDFSKAFDSVSHGLLLSKLSTVFGFSSEAVSMMRSYLSDRLQCVAVNGFQSQFLGLTCGLPQGSVLGPLLFAIFINDLPQRLNCCKCHLFADDFQLYKAIHEDNVFTDMRLLDSDLAAVTAWAKENRLRLNAGKTKAIVISTGTWAKDIPRVVFGGEEIVYEDHVLNLGLTVDSRLAWTQHAQSVSSKIFAGLRNMWPSARFIPQETKKLLVKSLLMPHFAYCCPVIGDLSASAKKILEKPFKACVRFVYGIGRYDSVSNFVNGLLGTDLFSYFDYLTSTFLHKVVITKEPDYVYERLNFGSSDRTFNLLLPRNNKDVVNRSMFVRGVAKYNALPGAVKCRLSLTGFKRACRNFYGL